MVLSFFYSSRPELLKGVYGMGFNRPSKIQERALPMLMASPPTNFIAQSQSGTGKTAAFVLAMLSRVDTTKNCPQVSMRFSNGSYIQFFPSLDYLPLSNF